MSETWVWNDVVGLSFVDSWSYNIPFVSNNTLFSSISASPQNLAPALFYDSIRVTASDRRGNVVWFHDGNEAYRTITFLESPSGDLLTFLQANATKQSTGGYWLEESIII